MSTWSSRDGDREGESPDFPRGSRQLGHDIRILVTVFELRLCDGRRLGRACAAASDEPMPIRQRTGLSQLPSLSSEFVPTSSMAVVRVSAVDLVVACMLLLKSA
jgi:hypothetical protein